MSQSEADRPRAAARIAYVCPSTGEALLPRAEGLARADGALYRFLPGTPDGLNPIPNFLDMASLTEGGRGTLAMYNAEASPEVYRNFLDWLFATFDEPEDRWRRDMAASLRLRPGDTVLVTGCGMGDDIPPLLDAVGPAGEVHAQDLSPRMIGEAAARWVSERPDALARICLSVGDALHLPYQSNTFDAAYHFGGINLYGDIGAGIAEMARVVRPGGRVVISDEGIAPWLRDTDYGRMVITNIPLWGRSAPIAQLPDTAADVALEWVLGQCFWVISFTVAAGLPHINPHVPHKGRRGGTMWTRHRGQLEGVTPETRVLVEQAAAAAGMSVHDWLERALHAQLDADQPASRTARPKPARP